ncbi:MAG: 50S ribosomal protein L24 [Candidatus Marsarchaeota archaeon]|nr:50S ribosomal protein L24 [Candidatus Marsarchaeota archaeon]
MKAMACPLSKDLKAKLKVRSLPVRTGDNVRVVCGGFKTRSGRVSRVNVKRRLVFIEGITGKAQKGKTKMIGIHVSNVVITKLDLSDKRRRAILERKGAATAEVESEFEAQKAESESLAQQKQENTAEPPSEEAAGKTEPSTGSSESGEQTGKSVDTTETQSGVQDSTQLSGEEVKQSGE